MAKSAAFLLLAAALALTSVAQVQSQGIGSFVGGIVDTVVDGIDQRTFFSGNNRCNNRPPQAPRNLDARARGPTSVRLTWRARDNSCVDYYEVTWLAEGQVAPRTFAPRQVKDFYLDIDGLEPNTRYVFSVRAVNARNGSSSSSQARATTPNNQRCGGAPRPPFNVQTRSDSPTTLTVAWQGVANDPCVERYEVTYLAAGQAVAPRSLAPRYVGIDQKSVTLTDLQPGTSYNVVIAAVSPNGQRATVTTTGATRPACPSPLRAPGNAEARQVGARDVRLTWNNQVPPACVRSVQVSWADGNGDRSPITTLDARSNEFNFRGLQPGRRYTMSVRYVALDGQPSVASSSQIFLPNNSQGGTVVVGGGRRL